MIVEGTAGVEVGEEVARLSAEALAVVPALVPHALANAGETTLRVVGFFSSAAAFHAYEDTIMPLGGQRARHAAAAGHGLGTRIDASGPTSGATLAAPANGTR
jgi:hypothetical protein